MFDQQPMGPPRPPDADFTTAIFARVGLDRYTVGSCVLGNVYVGWSARGVTAVRMATQAGEAAFADWYRERTGRRIVRAVEIDTIARAARAKLADSSAADVPLDLAAATPFERDVFERVREIRWGYARPHELIARELGAACTPQAVAGVLANNAVPLLIPCHRVVCEDRCCGSGYVFGEAAQQRLLAAEGMDPTAVDRVIERGFRYIENDGWFCLPTCGDVASHLESPGYAGLRSLAEAQARGLRACGSCRPLAA